MAVTMTDVIRYLNHEEWHYELHEDKNYVMMHMKLQSVENCACILSPVDTSTLLCYTVFPIKVPEERRVAVAEFLTRANYGLYHGNFEMDFSDGEVRYKTTGMAPQDESIDPDITGRMIRLAVMMLDRYALGILAVATANEEPAKALAFLQQQWQKAAQAQQAQQ